MCIKAAAVGNTVMMMSLYYVDIMETTFCFFLLLSSRAFCRVDFEKRKEEEAC